MSVILNELLINQFIYFHLLLFISFYSADSSYHKWWTGGFYREDMNDFVWTSTNTTVGPYSNWKFGKYYLRQGNSHSFMNAFFPVPAAHGKMTES